MLFKNHLCHPDYAIFNTVVKNRTSDNLFYSCFYYIWCLIFTSYCFSVNDLKIWKQEYSLGKQSPLALEQYFVCNCNRHHLYLCMRWKKVKQNYSPTDKWDLNLDDWFNTNALGLPQVYITTTPPLYSP